MVRIAFSIVLVCDVLTAYRGIRYMHLNFKHKPTSHLKWIFASIYVLAYYEQTHFQLCFAAISLSVYRTYSRYG